VVNLKYFVKFFGSFESETEFILLLEYIENGDLCEELKRDHVFTERKAAKCIY
jgi:hypothetical protein